MKPAAGCGLRPCVRSMAKPVPVMRAFSGMPLKPASKVAVEQHGGSLAGRLALNPVVIRLQVQPAGGVLGLPRPNMAQQPEKRAENLVTPQAAAGDAPQESKKILGYDAFTWQKIIPLGAMFFCILYNYTILRDTKVQGYPRRPMLPATAIL